MQFLSKKEGNNKHILFKNNTNKTRKMKKRLLNRV